jgi:ABC-type nitrate/sulfonate/bicarbonate transport system permease component
LDQGHDVSATSSSYWLWDYGSERRIVKWAIRAAAFVAFFGAWELVGRSRKLFAVVPASEVMVRMVQDLANRSLLMPTLGTLRIAFIGYGLAAVVGLVMGAVVGRTRLGKWTIYPLITVGLVTPIAILIPVLAVYFGFGSRSKVFLVFMFCVFVIAINTAAGVAETPAPLVETARAFGVSKWQMYSKVVAPHSLPYVLTGLRLAIGRAVQGAILADLLLESRNLGAFLLRAGSTFDMPGLLAGTFFIVVLGAGLMLAARAAERWLLRWLHA